MVAPANCEDDRVCKKQADLSRLDVGRPPAGMSEEIEEVGTIMSVLLAELALSGGVGDEGIGEGRSYRGKDGSWKGIAVSGMGSEKSSAEVLVASPYNGEDWDKACNGTSSARKCLFNIMHKIIG
jgi:hypothetical protein